MSYKILPIVDLVVNPANDRHGELENETAAIAQLFAEQELHMRNLAKDLVLKGEVFEPPLVFPKGRQYVVADGNRRTTCLKLLANPRRAPTVELQKFFSELREKWSGEFPKTIECRVEEDRDRVDDILYRRHTGVQGGIGQSTWTDRMKNNFVIRTGKSAGLNVADEIEKRLEGAGLLPQAKIPRANLNRLMSAEAIRNRVGISVKKGKLEIIRNEEETLQALSRIASDMATRKVTLDDVWDTERKLEYVDRLEGEGVLPRLSAKRIEAPASLGVSPIVARSRSPRPRAWPHLIPDVDYGLSWPAHLHRHRQIWEELQFKLELAAHPNAISVLLRVLLELSVDNYIRRSGLAVIREEDSLAKKVQKVASDLQQGGSIDKKYSSEISKLRQSEEIISIDTLNRYVHSPRFNVSSDHLGMLWGTLADFIVLCLRA